MFIIFIKQFNNKFRTKYDSNQLYRDLFKNNKLNIENYLKNNSKIWVLLVAGSKGWYNYRHQVFQLYI